MHKPIKFFFSFLLFLIPVFFRISFASKDLIPISIGILESFEVKDSTASLRYKTAYQNAILYAIGENESKLNQCGYKYQIIPNYFSNSNLLTAKSAANELENNNIWVIIGPTKSDQFIMATKGLNQTPMISIMAESLDVMNLKPPFFTMSPGVNKLAKAAVLVATQENLGSTYGVFVDATCLECKDFDNEFYKLSYGKLTRRFTIDGYSDRPSLNLLAKKLKDNKIDFLLLPNYSKFSGYVISQIHNLFPSIQFLGSDGWGQSTWSFIPAYNLTKGTKALSVRTGLSDTALANHYKVYSLDLSWRGMIFKPPHLAFAVISLIRTITDDICKIKPLTKNDFYLSLIKVDSTHYQTTLPISLYKLENNRLKYVSSINNNNKSRFKTHDYHTGFSW